MSLSVPPASSTAAAARRLRRICGAALGLALLARGTAGARPAQVRVLVGTSVSAAATSSMSPSLWTEIVSGYVNAQVVPFKGEPTLDACHKAAAAYMVYAPFSLRPTLPGVASASGRTSGQTRVAVTNCVTGDVVFDQTIPLDSDPDDAATPGDFEAVPETAWSHVAPAELARHPIFFARVSHVKRVEAPFAYIDTAGGTLAVGDTLRAFANARGGRRVPIQMTVTSTDGKYVQVVFSIVNGAPPPEVGDYVEPVATPRAAPLPTANPARR
jgi:hypothetical protein